MTLTPLAGGIRLDKFIAGKLNLTRSQIKSLNDSENILLNGKVVKLHKIIKINDVIEVNNLDTVTKKEFSLMPEKIKIDIVHEDEHIIVVNKPAGMVTHPAAGVRTGTLVNALLGAAKPLSTIGGELRQGIVHRLDKDTSGLLIIAKTNEAHLSLIKQLKRRKLTRNYLAIVHNDLKHDGEVSGFIGRHPTHRQKFAVVSKGGKEAITSYKVIERFEIATLVEVSLKTGRTHQIRVHMSYLRHPVVGDPTYGGKRTIKLDNEIYQVNRQMLHAKELSFIHPITRKTMNFTANLPLDFQSLLNFLKMGKM